MTRVILYRVEAKPQVISVSPDAAGGYSTGMEELLGGPVTCVPLHDGIQLCCNRGGLLFGLALARRALALSLAEPSRFEVRLHFENSELDLGPIAAVTSAGHSSWRSTLAVGEPRRVRQHRAAPARASAAGAARLPRRGRRALRPAVLSGPATCCTAQQWALERKLSGVR